MNTLNYRTALHLCALALLLLISDLSIGQNSVGRPFVTNYSTQEYNAATQNWAVDQGENGMLYFGNGTGLLEYNGVSWNIYYSANRTNIRCIDVGPDGRVYSGSVEDFGYFDHDSLGYLTYFPLDNYLPEGAFFNEIWTVYHTGDFIYYQAREQIYRMRENSEDGTWDVKVWDTDNDQLFMYAFYLDGAYYVHQRGVGLHRMQGDELVLIPGSEVLASDRTQVMAKLPAGPDGKPRYLIAQFTQGIYVFDGESFTPFELKDPTVFQNDVIYKGINLSEDRVALGHTYPGRDRCRSGGQRNPPV